MATGPSEKLLGRDPAARLRRTPGVQTAERAPMTPGELLRDQLVAGKYRIVRELGRGGMGVVYEARHLDLDVRVALKVVLWQHAGSSEVAQRLVEEARSAVRVRSEHAVQVLDVGQLPSGSPFLVMEYVEGESLQDRLDARGRLPLDEVIDLVGQAALGLSAAHSKKVVHRDVKPDNLLLENRGDGAPLVKVVDFGLSKRLDTGGLKLTDPAMTMGSPQYMSPEQIMSSDSVDARADVWALGVVLYEAATGSVPFPATQLPELFKKVLHDEVIAPSALVPELPPEFDAVVLGCLERDRDRRFADAGQVFDALMGIAPHGGRSSVDRSSRLQRSSHLRARRQAEYSRVVDSPLGRATVGSPQRRWPLGKAVAAACLVAGCVTAYALSTSLTAPNEAARAPNVDQESSTSSLVERVRVAAAPPTRADASQRAQLEHSNEPAEAAEPAEPTEPAPAAEATEVAELEEVATPSPSSPNTTHGKLKPRRSTATNSPASADPSGAAPVSADAKAAAWDIDTFGGRH